MGKLGWTEYEYYTCSPYMFLAACEGFLDKEKEWITIIREVAFWASGRSSEDFNRGWPVVGKEAVHKVWGMTKEEAQETREQVMKAHNIVLK